MSVARWALIVLLSIAVMLPPMWAISSWAVQRAEEEHRASRPKPPPGQKDLEMGLRGLSALVAYTAGSFVILWPLSLWACYRLLRGVGRRRPPPAASSAVRIEPRAGLVVTQEKILDGTSAPAGNGGEPPQPHNADAAWKTRAPAGSSSP